MEIRNMMITAGLVAGLAFPGASVAGKPEITLRAQVETLDPNGYVQCKVVVTSPTPINTSIRILAEDGSDVAEWGYSWIVSPAARDDGLYYREDLRGSMNDTASGCTATVSGARRKDIEMTLESIDSNGLVIDAAEGR